LTVSLEWSLRLRVSQIHFIGGEKGGVGKSVVARLLAQYWIDQAQNFAGIDCDLSHGALLRHYGDFTQAVDLSSTESADQILDRALGGDRRVVVDLPAQSAHALFTWLSGANVLRLANELGAAVTFWHVTDGGYASVGQVEQALDRYGDQARHVVVRNFARSKDFSQLENSPARGKLESLSGALFDLPELDAAAMHRIDGAGLSFWAAANGSAEPALRPLERERVRVWLARCYAQLGPLSDAP
jgi:hypothetical protein